MLKPSIRILLVFNLVLIITNACTPSQATAISTQKPPTATSTPDWFDMELIDVQTGESFTMNDYKGKVILLETMAIWCPTCILQAAYVYKLHDALNHPSDLISISLDVDLHENADDLKQYMDQYGFDGHFAIAPLKVDHALGNLYSAEYLNPPLAPMLIIDRQGNVHPLPYGLKDTETLQKAVETYLDQ